MMGSITYLINDCIINTVDHYSNCFDFVILFINILPFCASNFNLDIVSFFVSFFFFPFFVGCKIYICLNERILFLLGENRHLTQKKKKIIQKNPINIVKIQMEL